MKKFLIMVMAIIISLSFSACKKDEDIICSTCYNDNARFYKNPINSTSEKIALCKDCYERLTFTREALEYAFSSFND